MSELASRRGALGMIITGAALMLTAWAMYHLMRTGSCASGGVYVTARPCPAGTGGHVLGLMGSILGALAGAFVARSAILGILWFGMFFAVMGAVAILAAVGPASVPGNDSGGLIMGIVFIAVLGLPAVALALSLAGKGVKPR